MVAPCTKTSVLSLSSLLKSHRIGLGLPWLQHTGGSVLAVISQTHSPPSCLQQLRGAPGWRKLPFLPPNKQLCVQCSEALLDRL